MIRGFWTARSGLWAHQENMNLLANNMANVSTVGFKGQRTSFTDLIYQNINRPTATYPAMIGHGVRVNKTDLIMTQGALQPTDRFSDFALLSPEVFFAVQAPNGEVQFTRAGNFIISLDDGGDWYLAAPNGDRILDANFDPIQIEFEMSEQRVFTYGRRPVLDDDGEQVVRNGEPQHETYRQTREVTDEDGRVTVEYIYEMRDVQGPPIIDMDEIGIFRFDNPYGLYLVGGTRFIETQTSGEPEEVEGHGRPIRRGSLEASNVEIGVEMVRVIEASRAFSFSSRMVQIADEVEQTVNTLR